MVTATTASSKRVENAPCITTWYIWDPVMGPMSVRVLSYFPFNVTVYFNGHSLVGQELTRAGVRFRKADNAFLAVADVAALQSAADCLSAALLRRRCRFCSDVSEKPGLASNALGDIWSEGMRQESDRPSPMIRRTGSDHVAGFAIEVESRAVQVASPTRPQV